MAGLRIALDAFGSDRRPVHEVSAALAAAEARIDVELVGDETTLRAEIDRQLEGLELDVRARRERADRIARHVCIVHAPDQIQMDESPARAVRAKPDSSLCVAVDRVATGAAAAVVSAGNSGAILAASLFRIGRVAGVDRPAILTSFPRVGLSAEDRAPGSKVAEHTVLIDAGANVECKPLHLLQFAVLGATYARVELGLARPRVALLANGKESAKGTALTRRTHELLTRWSSTRTAPPGSFEFVGYVEPDQLFGAQACDVAVTDGWTGNIALKLAEGAMAAFPRLLREALREGSERGEGAIASAIEPALREVGVRVDPEAHGGAPLVGVDGAVIICHGAAGPAALFNAIVAARRFADHGLIHELGHAIAGHRELFELASDRHPER